MAAADYGSSVEVAVWLSTGGTCAAAEWACVDNLDPLLHEKTPEELIWLLLNEMGRGYRAAADDDCAESIAWDHANPAGIGVSVRYLRHGDRAAGQWGRGDIPSRLGRPAGTMAVAVLEGAVGSRIRGRAIRRNCRTRCTSCAGQAGFRWIIPLDAVNDDIDG